MKKGFTLIELLAVILILGIIALIAIPTVNNIIKEARTGAFLTSSNNMMKQIEQDCQTSLLKGENSTLSYTFSNNESSSKIEIKGTLPNDGYILLNKECTITDYYLSDNNSTYSNAEDVREDYMLKAPVAAETSILRTLYPSYYSSFVSVNFVKHLNIPENAIDIQDPSISQKGKIKSWLVPNGSNYDLYIGSEGTIYANYDSSYLFYNLNKNKSYDFSNFKTSFITDYSFMFFSNQSLIDLDVSNFDTSNAKNMTRLFSNCYNLKRLNISSFNTKNVLTLFCIFCNCYSLESIDVSKFDTSNVVDMESIFNDCRALRTIDVSNFDTSKVTNMHCLFAANDDPNIPMNLTEIIGLNKFDTSNVENMSMLFMNNSSLKEIDLSSWDFGKVTNFSSIFASSGILTKIKIKDVNAVNKISNYLPTKTIDNPGTITVIGDKTGINTTILESKHWNIN